MRYLYGDSSESALEINYLAFLRDAIDFGVAVLQAEHGLVEARERKAARDRAADEAARAIEQFGRVALDAVEPHAHGDAPINRCAASVATSIGEIVKRELQKVRGGQGGDLDQIVAELQRLREKSVSALGALLTTHDLPDADATIEIQWSAAAYEARMVQRVGWGLEAIVTLEIPSSSIFAHDLRVEKVVEGLEVHAPETAGWIKKELKMVPQKLGRHHVRHVVVRSSGVVVSVRASTEAGAAGFDISVPRRGEVTIERAGRAENEATFDTDERDVAGLRALAAKLETAVDALRGSRRGLAAATLDGKALATHEHPAAMVERLVAAMAPVVNEIARHSLSPRELVLKRLLGGDRREEIFLARAELEKKVQSLPPQAQRVFAPLGILAPITIESRDVELEVDASPPPPPAPEPSIVIEAEAPPFAQTPPPPAPRRAATPTAPPATAAAPSPAGAPPAPFPPASDLAATPAADPTRAVTAVEVEESGPSITLEADLPPARVRPGSLPSLPPLSPGGTSPPPPRAKGKTVPPPAPPQRMSVAATEAAVDAALRDLEDGEPTQVVTSAPRSGQ